MGRGPCLQGKELNSPQWRVGVYGSTAVAGGMVFPKFWGSTATLVGRVCDLLVDSFLLLMSYQILWQNKGKFTSSHWRTGVWIIRTIRYCMVTPWLSIVLWHSQNPCRVVALVIPQYWECWLKRLLNSSFNMGLKRNGNSVWMNVVTERAEHRMFHIMLDKFGSFTMTIGGFSFDIYYSLHDGKYWYV